MLNFLRTGILFAVLTALFMAVSMHIACSKAHVPYLAAKLICGLLVFACWSYPVQRRFVFTA